MGLAEGDRPGGAEPFEQAAAFLQDTDCFGQGGVVDAEQRKRTGFGHKTLPGEGLGADELRTRLGGCCA